MLRVARINGAYRARHAVRCSRLRILALVALLLTVAPLPNARAAIPVRAGDTDSSSPLTILVADPLAKELACGCVAGFAQRRYAALAMVLEKRLHRPVKSVSGTKLAAFWGDAKPVALIVGKYSDVIHQAREMRRKVYPIAALTNDEAATTLHGLFVVRSGNRAKSVRDLQGYRILFGPASCDEKHRAAIDALKQAGVAVPDADKIETVATCTDTANELMKLTDKDPVAGVISDYARVLLEGCHTIPKGSIRVVGKTAAVPFVTVFATDEIAPPLRARIQKELLDAHRFAALLRLLESKKGFIPFQPECKAAPTTTTHGWLDYRGPDRTGIVATLPDTLDRMHPIWTAPLAGRGLGGIAVTDRWVFATDQVEQTRVDYLKMFDARSGELRFSGELINPTAARASQDLDYGNSIRTTPVVHGNRVYVLDPFGALYVWPIPASESFPPIDCIKGMNTALLSDDFKLITWGVSSTPLITSSSRGVTELIVNSCSATSTLLALDDVSMVPHWTGAGHRSAYASCIVGTFGGRRQVVGFDSRALGGWDLDTGKRLWTVQLENEDDYIVPTPVALDGSRLLVVTGANCIRVYQFNEQGILADRPIAANEDISSVTVTPVAVAGKVYCTSGDVLYQLDANDGLRASWSMSDPGFEEHVSLIADAHARRLLVTTYAGELLLFDISGRQPSLISRRQAFPESVEEEIYAHPSVVGTRYYVRGLSSLKCLEF